MKNIHKMAVLGSALGLMLVSGAFAADDRLNPALQFGESPTIYDNPMKDQHSSDMTMAPKGARGPVRTESMEIRVPFGESPTSYSISPSTEQAPARDSNSQGGWNNLSPNY